MVRLYAYRIGAIVGIIIIAAFAYMYHNNKSLRSQNLELARQNMILTNLQEIQKNNVIIKQEEIKREQIDHDLKVKLNEKKTLNDIATYLQSLRTGV